MADQRAGEGGWSEVRAWRNEAPASGPESIRASGQRVGFGPVVRGAVCTPVSFLAPISSLSTA